MLSKYVLSSYQTLKQIMRVKEHTFSSSSIGESKVVSKQMGTGWMINDAVFSVHQCLKLFTGDTMGIMRQKIV